MAHVPITFCRPASEPEIIVRRFRTSRRRMTPIIRRLEMDWPNATGIMLRMAEYVTDGVVSVATALGPRRRPEPALFLALDRGLDAYQEAKGSDDNVRLMRFADAVLDEAARHLGGLSLSDPYNRVWSAADGEPLIDWLGQIEPDRVEVSIMNRADSKLATAKALAGYALTGAEQSIILEARDGCRE